MNRIALLLLVGLFVPQEAARQSIQTGKHFKIVCHFENDTIATRALETAEAAWPQDAEYCGAKELDGEPLEIHLYRTIEEYQAIEKKLTGGRFRDNNAFSSIDTQTAHIALVPPPTGDLMKSHGLSGLTRRLVAHESFHIVSYRMIVNARELPDWLAEGAATWIAEDVMVRKGWSPGFEKHPISATHLSNCREMLEMKKFPILRKILLDDLPGLPSKFKYSVAFGLFDYLQQPANREKLKEFFANVRRQERGQDFAERLLPVFEKSFGSFDAFDKAFHAHLATFNPEWQESYPSLDLASKAWIHQAFPDVNAVAWRTEPPGKPPYRLSGELQTLAGREPQMNVLLGRRPEGWISVAFCTGWLTMFHYHTKSDRWERIGRVAVVELKVMTTVKFSISVTAERITVKIDDVEVLSVEIDKIEMSGHWGLGAQASTAGIWRGVVVSR